MKIKPQIILAALGLAVCVFALAALYFFTDNRVDMSAIEHITQYQTAPNEFLDLANDIGVSSADDLGFEVKGDYDIIIYYGKQIIKMNPKCFESEEYRNALGKIGIRVYTRVNESTGSIDYRVTYWDTDIDQYSLVN